MTRGRKRWNEQQQNRLNTHKTALHDDRFCAIVHFNMRLMYDERENESFLCTRSNIFNSRKLNFVHYIFMCSLLLLPIPSPYITISAQATTSVAAFNVHFHTFISFPSSELLRCAMKNMKMFSSFFFFFFPFSSFHAKIVFL
jgi:hypothetical protein